MRILVFSDVHANSVALRAVLRQAGEVDEAWCLGDVVGYGPDPNGVVDILREMPRLVCLAGNHDLACARQQGMENFNPEAQKTILWHRQQLTAKNMAFLQGLQPTATPRVGITLAHGSPADPLWGYVLTNQAAERALEKAGTPMVMVGHTHYAGVFCGNASTSKLDFVPAQAGVAILVFGKGLANPGSLGQPRDGDPRAAYAIYEPELGSFTPCRAEYDVAQVRDLILRSPLPAKNGQRLMLGK